MKIKHKGCFEFETPFFLQPQGFLVTTTLDERDSWWCYIFFITFPK